MEAAILKATRIKKKGSEDRQELLSRVMEAVRGFSEDEWDALAEIPGAQDWYNAATEADNAATEADNADAELPDFSDFPGDAPADEDDDAGDDDDGIEEDAQEDDAPADEDDDAEDDDLSDEQEEEVQKKSAGKKAAKPAKAAAKAAKPVKAAAKAAKPVKAAAKVANGSKPPAKKAASEQKRAVDAAKKPTSMRRVLKMIVIKRPKMPVDELIEQLEKKGFASPSKLTVSSIRSDTRDTIKVLNEAGVTQIDL